MDFTTIAPDPPTCTCKNPHIDPHTTSLPTGPLSIHIPSQDGIPQTAPAILQEPQQNTSLKYALMQKLPRTIPLPLLFGVYGVLHSFLPGEPFLAPYLITEVGLTRHQVSNKVLPVFSYSHLPLLAVLGLATGKFLGYKTAIMLSIIAGQCTSRMLLLFGTSLLSIQFSETAYALGLVGETIFHSYSYTLVPETKFHSMNTLSRTSVFIGRFSSAILGQVLWDKRVVPDLRSLYKISAVTVFLAGVLAFIFFPQAPDDVAAVEPAAVKLQDIPKSENASLKTLRDETMTSAARLFKKYIALFPHIPNAAAPPMIVMILALGHYINVTTYGPYLWESMGIKSNAFGWVSATAHLFVLGGTGLAGYVGRVTRVHMRQKLAALPYEDVTIQTPPNDTLHLALIPATIVVSWLTFLQAASGQNQWLAFVGYVGTLGIAYSIVSVCAGEMAVSAKFEYERMEKEKSSACAQWAQTQGSSGAEPSTTQTRKPAYAGLLTLTGLTASAGNLILQTILSTIGLTPRQRFWVYSGFSVILVFSTTVLAIYAWFKMRKYVKRGSNETYEKDTADL